LSCNENDIKSLDVSKNTALEYLDCSYNPIKNLDVRQNTSLTNLNCTMNDFSAAALNALFRSLPRRDDNSGAISIGFSPGVQTCDKSIAENRGWTVTVWVAAEE